MMFFFIFLCKYVLSSSVHIDIDTLEGFKSLNP